MTAKLKRVKITDLRRDLLDLEEKRDEALEEGNFKEVMSIETEINQVVWTIQTLSRRG